VWIGETEPDALTEVDMSSASPEMARASPLPARLGLGSAVNPGSQGQLSRSDAHSFSYSLAPSTKGSQQIIFYQLSAFVRTISFNYYYYVSICHDVTCLQYISVLTALLVVRNVN